MHIDFETEALILDQSSFNAKSGDEVLKAMSEREQKQLLGVQGWKAWKDGGNCQDYLRLWGGIAESESRFALTDFNLQLFSSGIDDKMESDMRAKAEAIRTKYLKDGSVWKPGKLDKHVAIRKNSGHIPSNWTANDYERRIQEILANSNTEIYLYHKPDYAQDYFVYALRDIKWLVMIGENGIMDTAFKIDKKTYDQYLSPEDGYTKIGTVGSEE